MGPKITIVGGGSYQWVPKLLVDVANTPSLHDAELVLEDIDAAPLPRMVELVEHIAGVRGIGLSARGTTDQRAALDGADYVVVSISTGGFDSMRRDLEVPERYGFRHPVGDTVGPAGILRAQRNIPVLVALARDMEAACPDAWLLNLTNPMTTLCRAVTKETSIRTVGLCHELTISQFVLSVLLDANFLTMTPTVAGVNHLPFVSALDVDGADGLDQLGALLDDPAAQAAPIPGAVAEILDLEKRTDGDGWTKADLVAAHQVKFELFRRFRVLPAAGDRHLVEFFPGLVTEASRWGSRWGVALTTIEEREHDQAKYVRELDAMLASPEVPSMPSGEMVASVIDGLLRNSLRAHPLNLPNAGQVADLPPDVVVESVCLVDRAGIRGRDRVELPAVPRELLRRVSSSQELTVEAALSGDRDTLVEAMLLDPLAGRIDYDQLVEMTGAMVESTKQWLPQYA